MKKRKEKICLFIPPTYDTKYPPLGTPSLVGFLKSKGIDAVQYDLNILYYQYLKKNKLEYMLSLDFQEEKIRKKVYYYRILKYKGAHNTLHYEFEYNPGSSFAFTERMLSSQLLFCYISDKKENPFVNFFVKEFFSKINQESHLLIGFSITSPSQVMATFTFGYLIKKYLPKIKVVIGGQWVSLYREELQKRKDFFYFYDYCIFFEGETPLFKLVESLKVGRPFSEVPNLIYKDNAKWKVNRKITDEDVDKLPTPDFDGLPLKEYQDPEETKGKLTLTLETSRGCYWNRCIFCVDLPLPKPRYREKSLGLIIRDIKNLIKKYKVKHLVISNATFSPWQMKQISSAILKKKIKISWWTFARLDDGFSRYTLRLAKQAGCSKIGFGLESINQRVLDFVDKGTKVRIIKRIIKDCYDLKLNVYFQTMIGLPSEKVEEAIDTLEFVRKYKESIRAYFNSYYLVPKNKVFLNPESYGIKIKQHKRLPFRFFYPFEHITGNVDVIKAEKIIRLYYVQENIFKRKTRAFLVEPAIFYRLLISPVINAAVCFAFSA